MRQAYYENLPGSAGALLANQGFGWHIETAIHVLRLVLSGALARYPRLQLIIGHMGETLPMWLTRLDDVFGTLLEREFGRTPSQTMTDGATFLRQLPVSDADRAKIAHLNAERLLGISG